MPIAVFPARNRKLISRPSPRKQIRTLPDSGLAWESLVRGALDREEHDQIRNAFACVWTGWRGEAS